jgi:hypothetical protein
LSTANHITLKLEIHEYFPPVRVHPTKVPGAGRPVLRGLALWIRKSIRLNQSIDRRLCLDFGA